MRLALVANPGSGKGLDPSDVRRLLEARGAEVVLCEEGWKGGERARAQARGTDRVVAAGGDGIVGACADLARDLGIPLAVVPTGTANDFARAHELPSDVEAACDLAVAGTRTVALELAFMDGRPFVNAAALGLSPQAAERAAPLKRVLGPVAYPVGAAAAGVTGDPVAVAVRVDGRETFRGEAWQVIIAATGAFGAGAEIEEADPRDGRLDVVAVPAGPRRELARRALAIRRGTLAQEPGVIHSLGDEVELEVAPGTPFNVDGELLEARAQVVRFTAQARAYELVAG
jgi:diacylglycerol kinase family enzyme